MQQSLWSRASVLRSKPRVPFFRPLCIAVGALLLSMGVLAAQDEVYVCDQVASELLEFTTTNTPQVIDNLATPTAVAYDSAGNRYVSDTQDQIIYKYAPDNTRTVYISNLPPVFFMKFDTAGNLYASVLNDKANHVGSIVKITPSGTQSVFASGLTRTRGLAFDTAGNLYVADLDSGNIYKYTPGGVQSTLAGGFNYPTGIAFSASGNLFVCSQAVGVFEITPAGVVSTFTTNVTDPRYLAFDSAGSLYVTDVGDANGDSGQGSVFLFTPSGSRTTFASNLNFPLGIALGVTGTPDFFSGEAALANGVYYLSFPDGNYFGYYSFLSDPKYIYHFDLGYEYVFDAADGKAGVYFYDFKSSDFFYTSPTFPFPYLYDFNLNTVLYYYPDPNNAGHYNTNGVRYFYNYATGEIIFK